MSETKETWSDYSKLVLKELERLNDNHEKMRSEFDGKLSLLDSKLSDLKNVEKNMNINTMWIERVNDVWSPTQMKEAKDELYKQKSRWVATIAILTFIQIIGGILIALWGKTFGG